MKGIDVSNLGLDISSFEVLRQSELVKNAVFKAYMGIQKESNNSKEFENFLSELNLTRVQTIKALDEMLRDFSVYDPEVKQVVLKMKNLGIYFKDGDLDYCNVELLFKSNISSKDFYKELRKDKDRFKIFCKKVILFVHSNLQKRHKTCSILQKYDIPIEFLSVKSVSVFKFGLLFTVGLRKDILELKDKLEQEETEKFEENKQDGSVLI